MVAAKIINTGNGGESHECKQVKSTYFSSPTKSILSLETLFAPGL